MRDLERINPAFAKPATMASLSAFIPFIMSCSAIALADGAAPNLPFYSNPLALFFALTAALSLLMAIIPRLLKWDWDTRYFGTTLLYVGSAAIFGGVPWLCFLCFGAPPFAVRVAFFTVYVIWLFKWCQRFVVYYRKIYADDSTKALLYEIEKDGAFYMQKGDKALFEMRKFRQAPSNALFIVCVAAGVILLLFVRPATELIGLPFAHVFLGVVSIPIDMLALGQATRAWLIFFQYPKKIKRATGHGVYVDMGTNPSRL